MTPSSPLSPPAKKIKMGEPGKGKTLPLFRIQIMKEGCIFPQQSFPSITL